MAVSARLSELEQAILETLSLGQSQTDVIREGLRLVWERNGNASLQALQVIKPYKAQTILDLMQDFLSNSECEDPAWFRTIRSTVVP